MITLLHYNHLDFLGGAALGIPPCNIKQLLVVSTET